MREAKLENSKKMYPVFCSWCLKKGIKMIISYCEAEHSHGICHKCAQAFQEEIKNIKGGSNA